MSWRALSFTFPLLLAAIAPGVAGAAIMVTTTLDNGNNGAPTAGSLRAAIVQANAAAGTSQIDFSLSSCPAIFNLGGTALPDITNDVIVDGYSQSGVMQNTAHGAFNANLCVILSGAGSIADGLHTSGSGRLSVSGIIFVGFTDAAIRLDAGDGNVVSGNQIGGVALLAQNNDGVRISGTSVATTLGSVSGLSVPGAANLIVGNTGNGIFIDAPAGGNVVGGNVIGVGADGSTANGNNSGVYIFQSPNNDVVSNVIANNSTQGVTISGASSTGNTLQDNDIGATYNGAHAANGTQGVLLNFSAANNIIGAAPGTITHGNTIYALGAAVWVSSSGGAGNSILANQQMFSGNLGLPVDLDASGPTANHAGTVSGPNNLQNYPVLLAAYRTSTGEWVEGTLDSDVNSTYRLDFYWGPCCSGGGRGNATYFTGGIGNVTTDASGHVHFWIRLPANSYPSDGGIIATATDPAGDTSESGTYAQEIIGDMIFRDDFDTP